MIRKSLRKTRGVFVCLFDGLLACFVCWNGVPRPVAIMKKKFENTSWCVRLFLCWLACLFCLHARGTESQTSRNYEEKVWEKLLVCSFAYLLACLLVLFAGMESPGPSQLWRKSLRKTRGVFVCLFVGLRVLFACSWNRVPDQSQLWRKSLRKVSPEPSSCSPCGNLKETLRTP